jgi:hypothetical protein
MEINILKKKVRKDKKNIKNKKRIKKINTMTLKIKENTKQFLHNEKFKNQDRNRDKKAKKDNQNFKQIIRPTKVEIKSIKSLMIEDKMLENTMIERPETLNHLNGTIMSREKMIEEEMIEETIEEMIEEMIEEVIEGMIEDKEKTKDQTGISLDLIVLQKVIKVICQRIPKRWISLIE